MHCNKDKNALPERVREGGERDRERERERGGGERERERERERLKRDYHAGLFLISRTGRQGRILHGRVPVHCARRPYPSS